MKRLLFVLSLFVASNVHAATYLNWGIAVDYPGDAQYSDVQNFGAGMRNKLNNRFDYLLEAGAWKDAGHYTGAKSAGYGAAAIGLDLKLHEKYVSYFFGPACLSTTDTVLGANFQVYQKFSLGARDEQDRRIGFFVKHFSNGGLSKVNYGRNFVGLELQF